LKIIVAHPGTQHVRQLLYVLKKQNLLLLHFTAFAADKIIWLMPYLPQSAQKLVRRYIFDLPPDALVHFPALFAQYKLQSSLNQPQRIHARFEHNVIQRIKTLDYDLLIGYENSNHQLFRHAKQEGKITILDLAAVHHGHQQELYHRFSSYRALFDSAAGFAAMVELKAEAFRYTDYVFCLSTYARATLIQGGVDPQRIFVTNLGINLARFSPKPSYSTSSATLQLLFVGRMSHLKGLTVLLQALNTWNEVPFHCKLIGQTDGFDLENLDPRFQYIPFLDHEDLVKEYQHADVFLTCSYTDSWAQTVLEAMACGTPVIVTENTGAKDAVLQGGGFVIPVDDAEALREKIRYFYKNRTEIERLGRAARRIAEQYTWENYHQQVLAALSEIARRENLPQ
jgi:glycosyltransferase involved in cell wall biosynthesis